MGLFRSAATISGLTLLSRITGLARDILIARAFGAGPLTDAFWVAFRIPNLLRRLFAEGAFSQAFVPILGQVRKEHEQDKVQQLLDRVALLLTFAVMLVTAIGIVAAPGANASTTGSPLARAPQMPSYHLRRADHSGITLINIGVGPSNAKTITDHVAVLRPAAWLMLGHCAGLRTTQRLGDYVLAHGYVRQDHVLDEDLPTWVPIPPLAEIQVALEQAVAEVAGLSGWELKRIMRTGTVASIDNRNWELRDHHEPVRRLSQSRAIALDMESATIAANGFRFRVPYGTLLCVSDKPLHGELKLPGMASEFYARQVGQHLHIGIRALELLREMPKERLHSRKLRSFLETAFQ
jgi:AMP nucleosidase